jgi:hypothetical protein
MKIVVVAHPELTLVEMSPEEMSDQQLEDLLDLLQESSRKT